MTVHGRFFAAQLHGREGVELVQLPVTNPGPSEVRVRVQQCGVCSSNLPPWEGRPWFEYPLPPGAPGHEASGIVDAVGEAVELWRPGDRVAYIGQRGFAEYETISSEGLLRLPEEVGGDFLGEPPACALNIFRRCGIQPGDMVAIVGFGFLGRLLAPLAVQQAEKVLVITRREVDTPGGVVPIYGEDRGNLVRQVTEATGGRLCDVVIEATGGQEPLDLAAELTRIRGRLVIAGYHQDPRQVNMQLWNWRGLDVINAHERDPAVYLEGMRLALETVRTGVWRTSEVISHRFPLDRLAEAFTVAAQRPHDFRKAVIEL